MVVPYAFYSSALIILVKLTSNVRDSDLISAVSHMDYFLGSFYLSLRYDFAKSLIGSQGTLDSKKAIISKSI